MLFKEIPGNHHVKKQLIDAVSNNRVSHAQLFFGNSGCAKLPLAFAYARYINCQHKIDGDSCGKCSSCIKYKNLSHPDLHLIFPILKTGTTKPAVSDTHVNMWRDFILKNSYGSLNDWINTLGSENKKGDKGSIYKDEAILIQKKLSLKHFESYYRVFLIWMPEKMNLQTSNRLLKILEEPPKRTVFLLVSERPNSLLPTIISRTQITKIKDFSLTDTIEFFEKKGLSIKKIKQLRDLTESDFGKMNQLIVDEVNTDNFFVDFSSWMRLVYKKDVINILKWVDSSALLGRQNQIMFLLYAIKMIRECIIFNFADKDLLKTNQEESAFISKFAPFIHEENSIIIVEELERAIKATERNANVKILLFELSLQMIQFLKIKRKLVIN